ncbi:hypothetical protein [Listeria booriae]|uniref:Uncharacterized protein n=1 Tax=Listeria booriae TaxID=1552123 RepID=A0A841Y3G9_9LIST|nr:hypothetical protein [Listeria booriae]MBC1318528.1 hypothetical protein [Listeria booriae]MBC2388837.1 hypothetical protein [Listeria booriae]
MLAEKRQVAALESRQGKLIAKKLCIHRRNAGFFTKQNDTNSAACNHGC